MSVEKLKLVGIGPADAIVTDLGNNEYEIEIYGRKNNYPKTFLVLDRDKAHLLKLWLEEHLK